MAADPPGPLWPRSPVPGRLAASLELFQGREEELKLGPYHLITDVEDHQLIDRLLPLAEQTESVYAQRYDLKPLGNPKEAILFYEQEQPYRSGAGAFAQPARFWRPTGHTGHGMVLFYRGKRRPQEIQNTFVHELGHLLNRRSLGPALPPWLDEGLADDLANGKLDADGLYKPEILHGFKINWGSHVTYEGAWASLLNLRSAIRKHQLPSLETVLSYEWQEFMAGGQSTALRHVGLFHPFLVVHRKGVGRSEISRFLHLSRRCCRGKTPGNENPATPPRRILARARRRLPNLDRNRGEIFRSRNLKLTLRR